MRKIISTICAAVLSVTGVAATSPVFAAPIQPMTLERAVTDVQQIQHRRGFYRQQGRSFYNGHRGYRQARPGWRRYNGWWFPPSAFIAGAIVGGAIASQPAPVYRAPRAGSAHVRWCYDRYRSYRAYDNTFQPYDGPRQQCYSPYS